VTRRILVVHVAGIGDAAVASTVAERLRAESAGADVTWVCGEPALPIVRMYEGVGRVIGVDQQRLFGRNPMKRASEIVRLWSRLMPHRFDHVIVLHPDPRYRILVAPVRSRRTSFLSRRGSGPINPIPGRFLGDEYARLAGGSFADDRGPVERRYPMSDVRSALAASESLGRGRPRVVLVPGGARNPLRDDPLRRWPLSHYADVARSLADEGVEVIVVGAPHDAWVREAFDGIPIVDRVGRLTLVEMLAVLRDADVVVSHDTGPMHLARLVRAPLVALFGPTVPAQVLSIDDSVTVLWGGAHLACRPCFDGRHFAACAANVCLSSIPPEQVIEAVMDRLHHGAETS
jgi:heptosyltransferase-2